MKKQALLCSATVLLLSGCSLLRPLATIHAPTCELPEAQCAGPTQLGSGSTFEMALTALSDDQASLKACSAKLEKLRKTVAQCNQDTVDFNKKVDETNVANEKRIPWWAFWRKE